MAEKAYIHEYTGGDKTTPSFSFHLKSPKETNISPETNFLPNSNESNKRSFRSTYNNMITATLLQNRLHINTPHHPYKPITRKPIKTHTL